MNKNSHTGMTIKPMPYPMDLASSYEWMGVLITEVNERIQAGNVPPAVLSEHLRQRFGNAAVGIVGADGIVDTKRLRTLIEDYHGPTLHHRLSTQLGTEADTLFDAFGHFDPTALRVLMKRRSAERDPHIEDGLLSDLLGGMVPEEDPVLSLVM